MPKTPTRQDDEEILEMLFMRDGLGMYKSAIARKLSVTKNTVIGKLFRVKAEEVLDCNCTRPENRDWGMPERWWKQPQKEAMLTKGEKA
jgi:hypothetical protein